ncbi:MAG: iron ABC transporter [Phycisphaerae bacterium]|nr:iron ABC transporter [Phycisphaerae bacterium]
MKFSVASDLFPLLAGVLAALTCGLLGNFLVLRRQSLMGDAISHSVLPGLVIAFLIASTRSPLVMFIGAAVAGMATVILVELVKTLGRVEPGAAMGVVFSVLFALGVLLIEQAAARHVDLDAECVLHGQLESLVWYDAPDSIDALLSFKAFANVPRQIWTLVGMLTASAAFVLLLFKELRLAAFDPAMATTQGFNATVLHYLIMLFVAGATVASFDAVGSILVIAMLVCPAATARLLTDRLGPQIVWSLLIATGTAVGGYAVASIVPAWFGRDAVNAAGSMAVTAGVLLSAAVVFAPRHGLISRVVRRRLLASKVARDDLLATLYRAVEAGGPIAIGQARRLLAGRSPSRVIARAGRLGLVHIDGDVVSLTAAGRAEASEVVRRHRLWEHYLVGEAGLAPDHVHATAEQLEHLDAAPPIGPASDPHGRPIPARDR